ncbi:MAG TPA: hypothetical protein VFV03_05765 [Solirubrobacteraceae bacterium]|nr:hypothetical protein [Solirubrobacteraceae bacterium]
MTRLARAWGVLEPEQRLAAVAALVLVLTMLLPWYSKTVTVVVGNAARATQTSLSGIGAMSFVEAAVLLVSVGVLALLFARAENRAFHMPGSDGAIVTIAGGWAALLIFYRLLDKPSLSGTQRVTATVGVKWGIFFALAAACMVAYAGQRMRAASAPEPPLVRGRGRRQAPVEEDVTVVAPAPPRAERSPPVAARARPRYPPAPSDQLSFEDPPPERDGH